MSKRLDGLVMWFFRHVKIELHCKSVVETHFSISACFVTYGVMWPVHVKWKCRLMIGWRRRKIFFTSNQRGKCYNYYFSTNKIEMQTCIRNCVPSFSLKCCLAGRDFTRITAQWNHLQIALCWIFLEIQLLFCKKLKKDRSLCNLAPLTVSTTLNSPAQ